MAYYDHLTGLPNRISLYENFSQYKDKIDAKCAMLSIDVDNFKFINDTLGHSFGDQLIIAIGERISSLLSGQGVVYRLGGDEFIIAIHNIKSIEQVKENTELILYHMKEPYKIGDSRVFITVSIGIACYPEQGSSANELLMNSDIAMYQAKEEGKNRYEFYNQTMNVAVTNRMIIEKNLRTALVNNELFLHYQPQLDLKTDKITGFEALIRWQNPELGFVPPDRFISIAEDTQLIIPIGDWVLRKACTFLKELHNKGRGDISISVNISIVQLLQDDFVEKILRVVSLVGLDPCRLELEITESIVIESYEMIGAKLDQLRGKGIKIALDDFGKGFSSLSSLQNLKIDTLKIDKIFVDNILLSEEKSLVENIIMIGHKMGHTVLAEGVETKEQLDYLKKHDCHKMQGYYFSRPIPEDKAVELLKMS